MGRAKELMMEVEEAEWEESDATFYCPKCGEEVSASVDLPIVYEHSHSTDLPVTIVCHGCNGSFEGWVETDWDRCDITLEEYPDIDVEVSPARGDAYDYEDHYDQEYFEWLDQQERLARPVFQAFSNTIDDIKALTTKVLLDQQSQMLARMLLSQSITALETFLSDTMILTVTNNKEAQGRLLKAKSLGIGQTLFKLEDASGIENFAKDRLLWHLRRGVSFHNLDKVSKLFKVGLRMEILPEGDDLERIKNAIKMRHDCVHRNGVDGDTGQQHQIDQALLVQLTDTLSQMVTSIDQKAQVFEITV
ncbi:hypothetical protein [Sulfitobacter sp.]|uniref:hypothetical protein n=1 Tax=Sulfitobacter sp. TaxID=1903071 RepID=UPI003EF792D2